MSRLRPLAVVLCMLATSLPAQLARAQELEGVKIAVPTPRPKPGAGADLIAKSLRKELEKGGGATVVPAKTFEQAQKKLKLKGAAKETPGALARAGRETGADYVLHIEVSKKGWQFTAHAVVIDVATGEIQMDFRSGYFKPKQEAADRGARIAKKAIEKLAGLLKDRPSQPIAEAEPPPPKEPKKRPREEPPPPPEPEKEERAERNDAPPDKSAREPAGDLMPAPADRSEPRDPAPSDRTVAAADPPRDPPRRADRDPASSTRVEAPSPASGEDREILRASLSAGSGLLYGYDLSADAVTKSRLSYRLAPRSLFAGDAELRLPTVGAAIRARAAYSRLKYNVKVDETETSPEGAMLDLELDLRLHFALSSGPSPIELIPGAGIKFFSSSVGPVTPTDVIVSSRALIPKVDVALRLPLTAALELELAGTGGFVASYSESPVPGGAPDGGLFLGGALAARVWMTDAVGIAFDSRFDLTSVALKGTSERQAPANEVLQNVRIATTDLRASIGVALRI